MVVVDMSPLRNVFVICWILFQTGSTSSRQHHASPSDSSYDTIVIGAGAAGVAALTRLQRAGLKVLGLEAENAIGGRILTQHYGTGLVELGAEWVHGYNSVYKLAKEAGIPVMTTDDLSFHFLLSNGSRLIGKEIKETTLALYKILTTVRREPIVTFENYLNEAYKAYMSSSPDLITQRPLLESLLQWCKKYEYTDYSSGDWNLISTKGWTDAHPVDGPEALYWHKETGYHGLFNVLMNETHVDIELNKEVVRVNWEPDTVSNLVSVQCADGSTYEASTVIVTMSLSVLQANHEAMFTPPLPVSKVQSINNLNLGAVIKMALRYETRWWEDETNMAFIWDEESRGTLSEGDRWLEQLYGAMIATGSDNVLMLWLTGDMVWFTETAPLHELKIKLDWLIRKFCKPHFSLYKDSVELRRSTWLTNPHFLGSYSYHGLRSDIIDDPSEGLREPIVHNEKPRLLFGGEASSQHHFCTVHGAVESGWREADRILATRL